MLFGHQNNNSDQAAGGSTPASTDGVNPSATDSATATSLPAAPPPPPSSDSAKPDESASALNQPMPAAIDAPAATVPDFSASSSNSSDSTTSDTGATTDTSAPDTSSTDQPAPAEEAAPTVAEPAPAEDPAAAPVPADLPTLPADDTTTPAVSMPADDLLSLKQEALSQLSPLVDKLDQTPEEKFRTTMMLIQSTDDPSRIPEAYKAAQEITDEKVRAQALLDVVNEINYFTQSAKSAGE